MDRIFTIVDFPKKGETHGKYKSKTAKGAANKAFSELSRKINLKNSNKNNMMYFTIKEINTDKYYTYIGTRVELFRPIIVNIGGKKIEYKYKNIITLEK